MMNVAKAETLAIMGAVAFLAYVGYQAYQKSRAGIAAAADAVSGAIETTSNAIGAAHQTAKDALYDGVTGTQYGATPGDLLVNGIVRGASWWVNRAPDANVPSTEINAGGNIIDGRDYENMTPAINDPMSVVWN